MKARILSRQLGEERKARRFKSSVAQGSFGTKQSAGIAKWAQGFDDYSAARRHPSSSLKFYSVLRKANLRDCWWLAARLSAPSADRQPDSRTPGANPRSCGFLLTSRALTIERSIEECVTNAA